MSINYRLAIGILREHKYRPLTGTCLFIGRQTIDMSPEQAIGLLEAEGIPVRNNVPIEIDQGTYAAQGRELITDRSFFSLFCDAEVLALDVSDYEGAEILCDLNEPIPKDLHARADFIFNGSCLDNLFDPASALKNISRLLRPGGRIVQMEHGSPVRGAYIMYSPEFFFNYYAVNGFSDVKIYAYLFENFDDPWSVFSWQPYYTDDGEFKLSELMHPAWRNIMNFVISEKGEASTDDISPIQAFYRATHGTDKDIFFRAYSSYKLSPRPLMQLPLVKELSDSRYASFKGFSYVGELLDPK